jgi:hypothetical protein
VIRLTRPYKAKRRKSKFWSRDSPDNTIQSQKKKSKFWSRDWITASEFTFSSFGFVLVRRITASEFTFLVLYWWWSQEIYFTDLYASWQGALMRTLMV